MAFAVGDERNPPLVRGGVRRCVIGADGSAAWSDVLATGIPITRAKPFYLIIR